MKTETQTENNIYTSDQKLKWWGYGEWVEEVDELFFTYKDYECKVLRIVHKEPFSKQEHYFGGHLCGYVKIPGDHPCHSKDLQNFDCDAQLDCHGGVTFHQDSWVGFNCAHSGDYVPSVEYLKKTARNIKEMYVKIPEQLKKYSIFNPTYKNIQFCIQECKSVVDQLAAVSLKTEDGSISER